MLYGFGPDLMWQLVHCRVAHTAWPRQRCHEVHAWAEQGFTVCKEQGLESVLRLAQSRSTPPFRPGVRGSAPTCMQWHNGHGGWAWTPWAGVCAGAAGDADGRMIGRASTWKYEMDADRA